MMLVSIVIPVYNLELYIKRCIDSILVQTYLDIEIIVVDDGSTDRTNEILQFYFGNYSHIRILKQVNKGVQYARNLGIEESKGEFIFLLDGDDFLPENAIESLVLRQEITNADIVHGQFAYANDSGELKKSDRNALIFDVLDKSSYLCLLLENKQLYQTFKLIKRTLFDNVVYTRHYLIGEDAVAFIQILLKANIIANCQNIVYYYYIREDSSTNKPSCEHINDSFYAQCFVIEYIEDFQRKGDISAIIKKYLSHYAVVVYCFYLINLHFFNNDEAKARKMLKAYLSFENVVGAKIAIESKIAIFISCFFSPKYGFITWTSLSKIKAFIVKLKR